MVTKNVAVIDPVVADHVHVGERARQQRAAEAIADRVDLALAGGPLDRVERAEDALGHVIVEAELSQFRVGVDPGDHEYGVALRRRPADEAGSWAADRECRIC